MLKNIKICFMKMFLMFLHIAFTINTAIAQKQVDSVSFKGGSEHMSKLLFDYLGSHHGLYDAVPMANNREGNKYFIIIMTIQPGGKLGNAINIVSIQDTANSQNILNAIRHTDGNWINRLTTAKIVMLPLYFIYRDYSRREEKDPVKENYFYSTGFKDIICLEPVVIELFPIER